MFRVSTLLVVGLAGVTSHAACEFSEVQPCEKCEEVKAWVTIKTDCEIKPGVWTDAGKRAAYYHNNELVWVETSDKKNSQPTSAIQVNPGAFLAWHANGRLSYAQALTTDTELAPGLWARRNGSYVFWYENGQVKTIEVLARDFIDASGASKAAVCQTVYFSSAGEFQGARNSYFCK